MEMCTRLRTGDVTEKLRKVNKARSSVLRTRFASGTCSSSSGRFLRSCSNIRCCSFHCVLVSEDASSGHAAPNAKRRTVSRRPHVEFGSDLSWLAYSFDMLS